MPYTYHVIPHTHWDREWYMPLEQFRLRLVNLLDHLLDLLQKDPDFLTFHLDSQTIVVEDYLKVRPQRRAELEQLIKGGRISVGPWYQLNDTYLTSGEATIRSLLIGTRMAREFGASHPVGYLPDQFGNISQMPQIFRGFGIDNAIFGRGLQLVDGRKMEFLWESPDGSTVTASLMAFWYNNAQHFPADGEAGKMYLDWLRESMGKVSKVSHLLLMNGVDHLEPQEDLSAALAALRPRLNQGDRLLHSTLQNYMDAVKAEVAEKKIPLETIRGELREDRGGQILAGVLSTRMYLKQANHAAQQGLEKGLEPYAVFAALHGGDYPADFLRYAWKLLMENHPHDSICGCSLDAVHDEMMTRFAKVEQLIEPLTQRSLTHLADQVTLPGAESEAAKAWPEWSNLAGWPRGLVVFNPLSWSRTDPVRAEIIFPLDAPSRTNLPIDEKRVVPPFRMVEANGKEVPFSVIDEETSQRMVYSPVELPMEQWVRRVTIEFIAADVPACGYASYAFVPAASYPRRRAWEGEHDSGWIPWLEDVGDVGDEYLFRSPAVDRRMVTPLVSERISRELTPDRITQVYRSRTAWPEEAVGVERRSEKAVEHTVLTKVTRWKGIPRVEYETSLDNRSRDHRLRVVFRAPEGQRFISDDHFVSDGQFDVLERPIRNPLEAEGAAPFHPQQAWSALQGKYAGKRKRVTPALFNQGLPEIEIYEGDRGVELALTLLRGVGCISRRGDGPQINTPGGQCLGGHSFRYAFSQADGDWEDARIWQQAWQFNIPLQAVQTAGAEAGLPSRQSVLSFSRPELVLSALKQAEDVPGRVIVRCYNIGTQALEGARIRLAGATSAWLVNLNEETLDELELNADGTVMVENIRAKQILTLAFDCA